MICFDCGRTVDTKNINFCECDGCNNVFHYNCSGLTASEIKCMELKNKRTLKFFCNICQEGLKLLPLMKKKIDSLEEMVKELTNRLNINTEIVQSVTPPKDNLLVNFNSIMREQEDRKVRSKNIMIYNAPEIEMRDDREKLKADRKFVVEKLNPIVAELDIIKVIRVGKPSVSTPRPLKVVLRSTEIAVNVLRNSRSFGFELKVRNDLTVMQREHLKILNSELERRRGDGELGLTIKYNYGIPEIVKQRKNLQA